MNSRERLRLALDHRESDHVPLDLGATTDTSMHWIAYVNLRRHLGLPPVQPNVAYTIPQLVLMDEDVAERLETDARGVYPKLPSAFSLFFRDEGPYEAMTDEWGIRWRMPREHGFYYDMCFHPLQRAETFDDLRRFHLPDPTDDGRFAGLRREAQAAHDRDKAVILGGAIPGVGELYSWLRGYERFYVDLAVNQRFVAYMLDRLVEFKCAYWQRALQEVGDLIDVVIESEDMAGQQSLMFSPETYRTLLKPRHRQIFAYIKQHTASKIYFHSCGAIRPLLPDLIEIGIDILNPVQISAREMNPYELKRDFGRDLVFWGGGVDTQSVLGAGSPDDVRADVRRNIDALAPEGGFVFAPVHDIQPNVPPENIMAMWAAWKNEGTYSGANGTRGN